MHLALVAILVVGLLISAGGFVPVHWRRGSGPGMTGGQRVALILVILLFSGVMAAMKLNSPSKAEMQRRARMQQERRSQEFTREIEARHREDMQRDPLAVATKPSAGSMPSAGPER